MCVERSPAVVKVSGLVFQATSAWICGTWQPQPTSPKMLVLWGFARLQLWFSVCSYAYADSQRQPNNIIKSWKHVALRYGSQPTSTSTLAGKWDSRISLGSGVGRLCQIESKEIGKVLYGKASVDGLNRCFPCFFSWLWRFWRNMLVSISAKAHSWIPSSGSLLFWTTHQQKKINCT